MKTNVGAGLIEVMVSLLVTAIGLLGVLSVQATGINSNQRAEFVTEAQFLASDMWNMIAAYNAYDDPSSERFVKLDSSSSATKTDCSSSCSREEQYAHSLSEWSTQLRAILPSGAGTVRYDATTEIFAITVMWDEERSGVTGKNCSGNAKVDLNCFILEVQI